MEVIEYYFIRENGEKVPIGKSAPLSETLEYDEHGWPVKEITHDNDKSTLRMGEGERA